MPRRSGPEHRAYSLNPGTDLCTLSLAKASHAYIQQQRWGSGDAAVERLVETETHWLFPSVWD